MTTSILRGEKVSTFLGFNSRRSTLVAHSEWMWKKEDNVSNQLDKWTLLRLYYLLVDKFKMPKDEALALKRLMETHSLDVDTLSARLDEEISEELGGGVFTERMNDYFSLAVLDYILGKHNSRAVKELRGKLEEKPAK